MMRPSVQGVDPPVCCISWMLLLHMQETVLWIHRPGLLSSRGGAQISWHQSYRTPITIPAISPAFDSLEREHWFRKHMHC